VLNEGHWSATKAFHSYSRPRAVVCDLYTLAKSFHKSYNTLCKQKKEEREQHKTTKQCGV
jgi:hypothetical protein